MDISHGYVAWISLDMSGYLLDISCVYLFLDMSGRYPILPKDIQEISFHIQRYPMISRDIQQYPEISKRGELPDGAHRLHPRAEADQGNVGSTAGRAPPYPGDYHFFPNFFPKSLDSFQKLGKVWKSWKKVWKNFSKLYLLGTTILMPLYRVLHFQHVSKSTRRGSWQEGSLNQANDLSF